jgi:hypothetical protein
LCQRLQLVRHLHTLHGQIALLAVDKPVYNRVKDTASQKKNIQTKTTPKQQADMLLLERYELVLQLQARLFVHAGLLTHRRHRLLGRSQGCRQLIRAPLAERHAIQQQFVLAVGGNNKPRMRAGPARWYLIWFSCSDSRSAIRLRCASLPAVISQRAVFAVT